jgi:hypothetical protein
MEGVVVVVVELAMSTATIGLWRRAVAIMAWENGSLARGGEKCGGEVVESSRVGWCYDLSASSREKDKIGRRNGCCKLR